MCVCLSCVAVGLGIVPAVACAPPPADLEVWPSDALTKVLPGAAPRPAGPVAISGAQGETASGQIVVRPSADVTVRASCTGLTGPAGQIPASRLRLQWVRRIEISRNSADIPKDELIAEAPASIPDPFWEGDTVAAKAGAAQALWIEADIPDDAAAGRYDGVIRLAAGDVSADAPISLRVFGFRMPSERHQQVTNWFTFPGAGMSVKPDSDEYWALARRFAETLVRHRQTCFMTHLSLISTTYSRAEGFRCDFTRLDRWAATFLGAGMERMELFQAGRATAGVDNRESRTEPADLAVTVKDSGVKLTAEQKLRGVLQQLEKHIRAKGWVGKVMIHIADEPFVHTVPSYRAVARIVHEAAPSLRIIEAVEATGFGDAIDVLVPKLSHLNLWYPYFRDAHSQGRELWFYTCCHPQGRYPNRFLDQPLVKARALHWIQYLYGLDGFLHWGLNWFADGVDPYSEEGISQGLPLGDRAVLYPGKGGYVGSLRLSAMRDGLQDYEYLWTLEQRIAAIKKRLGADADWLDPRRRPLELCRRAVQGFYEHTRDGAVLLAAREQAAGEVEAIAAGRYLYVQTDPPDGSDVPAGPRVILIRGVADPGADITVNGSKVASAGPDGLFAAHWFLATPRISVRAVKGDRALAAERTFRLVD